MFSRIRAAIRRRIAVFFSKEASSLRNGLLEYDRQRLSDEDTISQLHSRVRDRDKTISKQREMLATQSHLREQAENEVERLVGELAILNDDINSLTDQLKTADSAAQTLREELAAERAELASVQHDLDRTLKQLELAQAENRLLAEIHETDIQRRVKERNIEQSQGEMALADARRLATEQHLEAA